MEKERLIYLIKSDLYRYCGENGNIIKAFLKIPGFKYTLNFRICNYFYLNKKIVKLSISKLLLKRYREKFGYEIPYTTSVGNGFSIIHIGGISINPKSIIGDNVTLMKGVTIGEEYRGKREGAPIIGSKVWIGSNSTVVGKVKIGNNVLIAPNTYINFDIPNNSLVLGNPAIVKKKLNATQDYLKNIVIEGEI